MPNKVAIVFMLCQYLLSRSRHPGIDWYPSLNHSSPLAIRPRMELRTNWRQYSTLRRSAEHCF
jgi:hypothetical protein